MISTSIDQWFEMSTAYVSEDSLHQYMNRNAWGEEGPVQNGMMSQLFRKYIRGRYEHDRNLLDTVKFIPIAEAVVYLMIAVSQHNLQKGDGHHATPYKDA